MLNEREIRAGAGILFLFALVGFMHAWLTGNFYVTKIFVIAFVVDFAIRIFINPSFSPSLILGKIFTRHQKPEYVGASQKRFAWGIGLLLGATMFVALVLYNVIGPFNLFVCLTCLILLFFESAFGICLGCQLYNAFYKKHAQLCPGGICDTRQREPIQTIRSVHFVILILFVAFVFSLPMLNIAQDKNTSLEPSMRTQPSVSDNTHNDPCVVPAWAKKIGHEEQYKLHNGCK